MAQGIKIYNDTGTASTTLDFGNPSVDRTVVLDGAIKIEALSDTQLKLSVVGSDDVVRSTTLILS